MFPVYYSRGMTYKYWAFKQGMVNLYHAKRRESHFVEATERYFAMKEFSFSRVSWLFLIACSVEKIIKAKTSLKNMRT